MVEDEGHAADLLHFGLRCGVAVDKVGGDGDGQLASKLLPFKTWSSEEEGEGEDDEQQEQEKQENEKERKCEENKKGEKEKENIKNNNKKQHKQKT